VTRSEQTKVALLLGELSRSCVGMVQEGDEEFVSEVKLLCVIRKVHLFACDLFKGRLNSADCRCVSWDDGN
jgi:hypothetical protein